MTCQQIIAELQTMGSETTQRIFKNHGATGTVLGVKVEDLKKIQKKVKKNHQLALELYDSGISDARYLAGLIADESKMTKQHLQHWAHNAGWHMISEYTVPWVASESMHGYELALEWIKSAEDSLKASGWATLASLATVKQDSELDLPHFKKLLQRVVKEIASAPNRTRYAMNGFVIAVGCTIKDLTEDAMEAGRKIGKVQVNMGGTACCGAAGATCAAVLRVSREVGT